MIMEEEEEEEAAAVACPDKIKWTGYSMTANYRTVWNKIKILWSAYFAVFRYTIFQYWLVYYIVHEKYQILSCNRSLLPWLIRGIEYGSNFRSIWVSSTCKTGCHGQAHKWNSFIPQIRSMYKFNTQPLCILDCQSAPDYSHEEADRHLRDSE